MSQHKIQCKSVQRLIAAAQSLSPEQLEHVEGCQQCATLRARLQRLDQLVKLATAEPVPPGFSEQVMARLSRQTAEQTQTSMPFGDKLLATFSRSRLLRSIALSLGIALGIWQLVQFILGIFFVSMMAAM